MYSNSVYLHCTFTYPSCIILECMYVSVGRTNRSIGWLRSRWRTFGSMEINWMVLYGHQMSERLLTPYERKRTFDFYNCFSKLCHFRFFFCQSRKQNKFVCNYIVFDDDCIRLIHHTYVTYSNIIRFNYYRKIMIIRWYYYFNDVKNSYIFLSKEHILSEFSFHHHQYILFLYSSFSSYFS